MPTTLFSLPSPGLPGTPPPGGSGDWLVGTSGDWDVDGTSGDWDVDGTSGDWVALCEGLSGDLDGVVSLLADCEGVVDGEAGTVTSPRSTSSRSNCAVDPPPSAPRV
ncbi:hypothetical protein EES42_03725 [Streptomyces sp. ADI95-17]|nr:hypothetical protein EES42_03725 [Streptomyces sp. ADI95-17]